MALEQLRDALRVADDGVRDGEEEDLRERERERLGPKLHPRPASATAKKSTAAMFFAGGVIAPARSKPRTIMHCVQLSAAYLDFICTATQQHQRAWVATHRNRDCVERACTVP